MYGSCSECIICLKGDSALNNSWITAALAGDSSDKLLAILSYRMLSIKKNKKTKNFCCCCFSQPFFLTPPDIGRSIKVHD